MPVSRIVFLYDLYVNVYALACPFATCIES